MDFKRQVGANASERRRFAEHLASFAADGGWVVVGVDEDAGRFHEAPVLLDGQRERIDSLAHTAIDPPLFIESQVLPLEGDAHRGFVLVRIPPSPHVLHAVDGRYWGRRDVQKARLADGDVSRLMRLRMGHSADVLAGVRVEAEHAPKVSTEHYYRVVARCLPRTPQRTPLRSETRNDALDDLSTLFRQADAAAHMTLRGASRRAPITEVLFNWQRRAGGAAWCSRWITPTRKFDLQPERDPGVPHVELLVEESGAVQLWTAENHHVDHVKGHLDTDAPGVVSDWEIVSMSASLLLGAAEISRRMGFDGVWDVGVQIDGCYGLVSRSRSGSAARLHRVEVPYSDRRHTWQVPRLRPAVSSPN